MLIALIEDDDRDLSSPLARSALLSLIGQLRAVHEKVSEMNRPNSRVAFLERTEPSPRDRHWNWLPAQMVATVTHPLLKSGPTISRG